MKEKEIFNLTRNFNKKYIILNLQGKQIIIYIPPIRLAKN